MNNKSKDYGVLPGFEAVYLEDSYVLNIAETPTSVEFDLELVLTEEHPLYDTPLPGEKYCYKKAKLQFLNPQLIKWIEKKLTPYTDATSSVDYGNIDSFEYKNGEYFLTGDWGTVHIACTSLALQIDSP